MASSHFSDFDTLFTATAAAKYIIAWAQTSPTAAYIFPIFNWNKYFVIVIIVKHIIVIESRSAQSFWNLHILRLMNIMILFDLLIIFMSKLLVANTKWTASLVLSMIWNWWNWRHQGHLVHSYNSAFINDIFLSIILFIVPPFCSFNNLLLHQIICWWYFAYSFLF